MTNAPLDIQPALRSPHVSVRGGRLTKFKGQVASIAPGLSVVATAAALLAGGADQAAAQATAVRGCAGESPNQTVGSAVTCNTGTYSDGIQYDTSTDLTLRLDQSDITVNGDGVQVNGTGTADITVHMTNGKVDGDSHGVSARTTGTGSVHAQLDGDSDVTIDSEDSITVNHAGSAGLRARIDNAASEKTATATMAGGKITVANGVFSEGVSAFTSGFGDAIAEMSDGLIVTEAGADPTVAVNASVHNDDSAVGTATTLMTGGTIETRNIQGIGLRATTRATSEYAEAKVHMSGGKITTHGEVVEINGKPVSGNAHAISAQRGDIKDSKAKMTALMTGGEIETISNNSAGVRAFTDGLGNALAKMDQTDGTSTITTRGNQSHGLQAFALALLTRQGRQQNTEQGIATAAGIAKIEMVDGTITIHNINAHGAHALAGGIFGKALVEMSGGSITTHDSSSYGLYARIDNIGNDEVATAEMTGGTIVTGLGALQGVSADGSHGIFVDTSGSGDMIVDMSGLSSVTTHGNASHGIHVEAEARSRADFTRVVAGSATQAKGVVKLGAHASVTAEGSGSDGIRVSGNRVDADDDASTHGDRVTLGAQGFDIDVAGDVTGGAGNGAAIRTMSSDTGTIDIASTAHVNAGGSGIAIRTETAAAGGDGVPIAGVDDGTATITSAGMISGDILLDAGDDTLIVTGGSITGDVYGSQGDNTLRLERGRFTGDIRFVGGDNILEIEDGRFTGGIYGGAGNDTVTISADATYVGSHVLDGGAGGNDQLTLHGQTISNTAENFRNWERVTLNDTNLRLAGVSRLDIDQLSINAGSAFRASGGGGGITIAGDVINNGSVILDVQDGNTGDVITIEGDYTGSGTSVFALDAVLAGNDAETDRLVINGDASGEMMLSVTNLDSAGGEDTALEIDVVSVTGEFDGTFTLVDGNHVTPDGAQAVVSGAHLYRLAETGRGWALSALSSTGGRNWQPSAPIYDSYGQSLLALNGPASLRKRGSSEDFRSLAWDGGPATQSAGSPLWFQMGGERITTSEEHSTTGAALESSIWEMEIGGDVVVSESGAGLLVGGLMFSYATGSASVSSEFGDGSIDTSGFGLGVAATWYDHRRFYVDGQVSLASYSSDLEADRIGTLTDGNGGTGLAFSIEAGQQLDLGSSLTVIPQAQLSLSSVEFDDFEGERYGEQVTLEDASSRQLRLGLEFGAQEQGAHRLYGIVNLFHEFGAGSEVNVAGATLTTESEPWAVGVGLGGNYALTDRVDLFGEASYATGLSNAGDTSALSANAGLKMVF